MKRQSVLALFLALSPSYSYCEPFIYGISPNAASTGMNWSMGSVLPSVPGLDVNGIIYRYTTNKNTEDDMKVTIGNSNADGTGYTFRETDDWSGLPGNTITKKFLFNNIPSASWGDGSIEIEGEGTVESPVVAYSYRVDLCADPQTDPSCSGYVKPKPPDIEVELYNPLEDDVVIAALDQDPDFKYDEDGNLILDEPEEEEESRLEMGLMAADNALTIFKSQGQAEMISQINLQTDINMYYNAQIGGGLYADVNILTDDGLSDNNKALRNNLAQQLLHEQMVQSQYGD